MVKFVYNDYFFYKLVCLTDDIDLSYVGSTANWRNRKYKHNSNWNNPNDKEYTTKKYQLIRENGGMSNFKMVQIGFREHLTQREAEAVEEEYRIELRANMNGRRCNIGNLTQQEYTDEKNEYAKHYRQDNKTKLKEKDSIYYQKNSEKIKGTTRAYYHSNKEKINEKNVCEVCGGRYTHTHRAQHIKSKKHEKAVSNSPSTSTDNSPISN